jgi:hypothetical protein
VPIVALLMNKMVVVVCFAQRSLLRHLFPVRASFGFPDQSGEGNRDLDSLPCLQLSHVSASARFEQFRRFKLAPDLRGGFRRTGVSNAVAIRSASAACRVSNQSVFRRRILPASTALAAR